MWIRRAAPLSRASLTAFLVTGVAAGGQGRQERKARVGARRRITGRSVNARGGRFFVGTGGHNHARPKPLLRVVDAAMIKCLADAYSHTKLDALIR